MDSWRVLNQGLTYSSSEFYMTTSSWEFVVRKHNTFTLGCDKTQNSPLMSTPLIHWAEFNRKNNIKSGGLIHMQANPFKIVRWKLNNNLRCSRRLEMSLNVILLFVSPTTCTTMHLRTTPSFLMGEQGPIAPYWSHNQRLKRTCPCQQQYLHQWPLSNLAGPKSPSLWDT
jgi:hypothetical protein